ncbi:BTAD domain-containing putative transcriptional regulator [Mangrovicoccus sp. HB161399]|uniref:AfsR/SARP family transcriptional regulator n=1 Tax=Mangrovicoccus sp. HB161399 TaxID=2720392 RepID=UPI001554686B|nr:BTAD domain-containing putative transcriptional regulator [Mangrovicoccus sp. HB161399]
MTSLSVTLFGAVRVTDSGSDIDIARSAQTLLSYLLLNRGGPIAREKLADTLWHETGPEKARSRLSTSLWRLRRQLGHPGGEELVQATPSGELHLSRSARLWLDVAEFETEARRCLGIPAAELGGGDIATLERVLGLFARDLMEGHYDDWVLLERTRLNDLKEQCLAHLILANLEHGRNEPAIQHGQALLAIDPLREEAHRWIMLAQARLGRPHLVRRQFDACRDILREELGAEPVRETVALLERLGRQGSAAAALQMDACGSGHRRDLLRLRQAVSAMEIHLGEIAGRLDRMLGD